MPSSRSLPQLPPAESPPQLVATSRSLTSSNTTSIRCHQSPQQLPSAASPPQFSQCLVAGRRRSCHHCMSPQIPVATWTSHYCRAVGRRSDTTSIRRYLDQPAPIATTSITTSIRRYLDQPDPHSRSPPQLPPVYVTTDTCCHLDQPVSSSRSPPKASPPLFVATSQCLIAGHRSSNSHQQHRHLNSLPPASDYADAVATSVTTDTRCHLDQPLLPRSRSPASPPQFVLTWNSTVGRRRSCHQIPVATWTSRCLVAGGRQTHHHLYSSPPRSCQQQQYHLNSLPTVSA